MNIIAESDIGWVSFEGNELTVGSKIDDPPKVRLASPLTPHGGGGGVISANFCPPGRSSGGHEHVEIGMIRFEQAEDVRGTTTPKGELNFLLNYGGTDDAAMQKPLAFVWNALTRLMLPLFSRTDTMWAPDGMTFTQQQSDGNFVSYQASQAFSKENVTPLWSAWTGRIGN